MSTFEWSFPYPSQRMPLLAQNAVSTSQPLAAQAGVQMLAQGGNAVDAALAAAITLTVVEPCSNGIGGDAFAMVWDGQRLHGLNASGRAPKAWSPERFQGLSTMPQTGWESVIVPGCVAAWTDLSARFGKLPFAELFQPAIRYASHGFLVSPTVARQWSAATHLFDSPTFASGFLPQGRPPQAGEKFSFPDQARTLAMIAQTRGKEFYCGDLAQKMVAHAKEHGAALSVDDLKGHRNDWVTPVTGGYRGYTLHEIPPNGQGLAALIGLGILEHFDVKQYAFDSVESVHLQIEAMKLAFADAYAHIADPAHMQVAVEDLLSPAYLKSRAQLINMQQATHFEHGVPRSEGTVYVTAADASGMMVSFIQSNFRGFGSGIVVPGTGISMANRGSGFNLQNGHPNQVGSGKRPFHTIIPGFVSHQGRPLMSFGVMGANMQPQGHLQTMVRLFDYGMNPQTASDAPKWKVNDDFSVLVEHNFPEHLEVGLRARGHVVTRAAWGNTDFGCGQFIYKLKCGYLAAADHRKDSQAAGF